MVHFLYNSHYVNQMDNRMQWRFPKLSSQIEGLGIRHLLDERPRRADKECAGDAPGRVARRGVCAKSTPVAQRSAPIHWGACVALCSHSFAGIRMGVSA